jgi:hypothetical protein
MFGRNQSMQQFHIYSTGIYHRQVIKLRIKNWLFFTKTDPGENQNFQQHLVFALFFSLVFLHGNEV